ncbi:MAG: ABC transporter permease [Acidimicrobiia bacterium]
MSDTVATESREAPTARGVIGQALERLGMLGALIVLGASLFFLGAPKAFQNLAPWQNVAKSTSTLIVASLALLIPLIAGHFNLAVGAQIAVAGMVCVSASEGTQWFEGNPQPVFLCVILGILASVVISVVSGYLVAYVGVDSFITTLGIAIAAEGWYSWYNPTSTSLHSESPLLGLFSNEIPVVRMPPVFLLAIAFAVLSWVITEFVPLGRKIAAIGSNPSSASLVGIRVPRTVFTAFLSSGLLAGVAGVMALANSGNTGASTFPGGGVPFILPALAAVFLGATTWKAGRFNVPGVVIAILLIKLANEAFSQAGYAGWVEKVINGLALVAAVAVSTLLARRRTGSS